MKKWRNVAKKRLAEIQADESAAADMRAIAEVMAKLPHGQLKKILSQDVVDILAKYGVVLE